MPESERANMRPLIAGNWKMNGLGASLGGCDAIARGAVAQPPGADTVICVPATLIARAVAQVGGRIAIGGQNCHAEPQGAYTGEVSAEMLMDAGATFVIVGHSERRHYLCETDSDVAAKTRAAWRAGLVAIVCVGEVEGERDAGRAFEVVASQLSGSLPANATAIATAIAYEPVWAIGTGRTPSSDEIAKMHAHIRIQLVQRLGSEGVKIRVLYGGSVKPANAREILAVENVNGALIGGASLQAASFLEILAAVPPSR